MPISRCSEYWLRKIIKKKWTKITKIHNKYFPKTCVKFHKYKHKLTNWITSGILKSTEFRHKLYKYWNWCRCIQRKDSAGVILTASWFNDINIGYRFHISTVCHSCCNNVMYFSKENLDISGSAWKNVMLAWHSCWHGLSWYWNYIYRARAVFAPCKHQQPDYSPVLAYYLWHILIFALYKYDSNKCIQ